jgi:hypothetical protein
LEGIDVFTLEPRPRQRLVVVGPESVWRLIAPRRPLSDHHARVELIVRQHVFPLRRFAEDQNQIGKVRFDGAVLVQNQLVGPIALLSAGATA